MKKIGQFIKLPRPLFYDFVTENVYITIFKFLNQSTSFLRHCCHAVKGNKNVCFQFPFNSKVKHLDVKRDSFRFTLVEAQMRPRFYS